ncbi:alpha/beta hydrolase [bacterium]|jgi:pimeloyl-ACP methyl ester carboxylesterase|nr:alpha/beta hydrolase [bacterium]
MPLKRTGPPNAPTLIIPGWGTDAALFSVAQWSSEYQAVERLYDTIIPDLSDWLAQQKDPVRLIGFSLGGFIAIEAAKAHPDRVSELILIGVMPQYEVQAITQITTFLNSSPDAYMAQFYKACTTTEDEWITLQNEWKGATEIAYSAQELIQTLSFLETLTIQSEDLDRFENVTLIHGRHDVIAPIESARQLWAPHRTWIEINSGHIPFLSSEFTNAVNTLEPIR